MSDSDEYKGYVISGDGPGFYKVANPRGEVIGTCEGISTAFDLVDEHIEKVYAFWNLNCVMSPLIARAARRLSNAQAEAILADQPIENNALNGYSPIKDGETDREREQRDYEALVNGRLTGAEYDARWGASRGAR